MFCLYLLAYLIKGEQVPKIRMTIPRNWNSDAVRNDQFYLFNTVKILQIFRKKNAWNLWIQKIIKTLVIADQTLFHCYPQDELIIVYENSYRDKSNSQPIVVHNVRALTLHYSFNNFNLDISFISNKLLCVHDI